MSDNKKYYWLKLKDTFFNEKEIKKLRKIAGGDTYTIIYLKLQLLSIKTGGKLCFEMVEETFEEEIALVLDEEVDNVKITLAYLQRYKLIEAIGDNEYLIPSAASSIGSESDSAERVRRFRDNKTLQCNEGVTEVKRLVTTCNTEIEIEKIKEKKNIYCEAVKLTEKQYKELITSFGEAGANDRIENLSLYIRSKGDSYKCHYSTILSWERKHKKEQPIPIKPRRDSCPDLSDYDPYKL